MKYRLVSGVLALACLLVLFMAVPRAQAHPRAQARPFATTVCDEPLGCAADVVWDGSSTNHGNGSTFTVDNPGGSGFQYYLKGVDEQNANGWEIFLGVVKNDTRCSGLSFIFYVRHNGDQYGTPDCQAVPSGDINHLADMELSYYVSNGGGIFYNITGFNGNIWHLKAFACSGCTQAFDFVENDFLIGYTSFTGHAVWGGQWIDNEYFDGSWHYDTTAHMHPVGTSNDNGNGNPPQMFWASPPNGAQNTGGDLRSCLYDTGSTCNLGS